MIFVTIGTQKFPFDRLLKKIDELIESGFIKEKVIAQVGNSAYSPRFYEYTDYIKEKRFNELLGKSRIIITHGGVGTITKGLTMHKKVLIVPRLKKYNEHVDDHQIEIAEIFYKMKYAMMCRDMNCLEDSIRELDAAKFREYDFSYMNLAEYVQEYLISLKEK